MSVFKSSSLTIALVIMAAIAVNFINPAKATAGNLYVNHVYQPPPVDVVHTRYVNPEPLNVFHNYVPLQPQVRHHYRTIVNPRQVRHFYGGVRTGYFAPPPTYRIDSRPFIQRGLNIMW